MPNASLPTEGDSMEDTAVSRAGSACAPELGGEVGEWSSDMVADTVRDCEVYQRYESTKSTKSESKKQLRCGSHYNHSNDCEPQDLLQAL